MFCPGCGKQLPENVQFCPSCGRTVEAAAAVPAKPAVPSTVWTKIAAMQTWKKVVLGGLLGFVLLVTFVVALVLQVTSGLLEPVDRHFAALKAHNLPAAYAELAISTRQQNSLASFTAMVGRNPPLSHVVGQSYSSRSFENGLGKLEGMLEIEGGGKLPISVHLVKENGEWKILSYEVKQ